MCRSSDHEAHSGLGRSDPRLVVHPPEGRPARRPLARGKLRGLRRLRFPSRRPLGGFTPSGRHHHLRRLALRHRGETQCVAAAFAAPRPHFRGPRVGRRDARRGRHRVPDDHGGGRHRRRTGRVHDRARGGHRGTRGRDPRQLRPGRRRQQQSAEPDHQYALVRRGPERGGATGPRLRARSPRERHARHPEALPGARRHRDRLAHPVAHHPDRLWPARHAGARALPRRDRRRGRGRDELSHRVPRPDRRGRPQHAVRRDAHWPAARLAQVPRPRGHRRLGHGRRRSEVRRRRSHCPRVPRRLGPAPHAHRPRFRDRRHDRRGGERPDSRGAARHLSAPRARDQAAPRPVRAAHGTARLDHADRRREAVSRPRQRRRRPRPHAGAGHRGHAGAPPRHAQPARAHRLRRRVERVGRRADRGDAAEGRRHGHVLPSLAHVGIAIVRFGARGDRPGPDRRVRDQRPPRLRPRYHRAPGLARPADHGDRRGEADGPGVARQPVPARPGTHGEVLSDRLERRTRRRAGDRACAARLFADPREAPHSHSPGVRDRPRNRVPRFDAPPPRPTPPLPSPVPVITP